MCPDGDENRYWWALVNFITFSKMPYGQHLLPSLHTQIKAFVSWQMQGRSILVGFWTFRRNSSSIHVGEWKPKLLGSCIASIPTTAAHCASTRAERGNQRLMLADNNWPRHCLLGVQYLLQGWYSLVGVSIWLKDFHTFFPTPQVYPCASSPAFLLSKISNIPPFTTLVTTLRLVQLPNH